MNLPPQFVWINELGGQKAQQKCLFSAIAGFQLQEMRAGSTDCIMEAPAEQQLAALS